jgi:4-hydroxybenzoate polyprenyltransferase
MNTTITADLSGFARFKLFLALSRTPHGLLDLATPLLAALLWLGRLPPGHVAALGILAAFAGYTAVYALNDIVDYRTDMEKISQAGFARDVAYLDAALVRHPLARGLLRLPAAVAWAGGWALVSLIAAYLLNPVCAFILIGGCLLETVYCLLLRVSQLRALVSGVVKTLGGLAAVFAVDPSPEPSFLLLLFLWLFFWEIGGQNVPADWHDIEEDAALAAKTVPVVYGPRGASIIVLVTLTVSVVLSGFFLGLAPAGLPVFLLITALAAGAFFLLWPAVRLFRSRDRKEATVLFNRASYYPLSLLVLVAAALLF